VAKLMTTTKTIAVTKMDVPAADFKADGDPDTVQIVFLQKKGEKSRVSEDGEVIFLAPRARDKVQQELLIQAFAIKIVLRKAAETGCKLP
jgi:hypothetical protein